MRRLATFVLCLFLTPAFAAEPPNGAAQQFQKYGDRGFEKDKPVDQRVVALEIKVELLQRQLADILWALEELDKKLPPSLKEAGKRKAGPASVSGPLRGFNFTPGRKDGLVTLSIDDGRYVERHVFLLTQAEGSAITWNGNKVADLESLLRLLAGKPVKVTVYPELEFYGAARKADFTTVPEAESPAKEKK
jgi:hypothetical protein